MANPANFDAFQKLAETLVARETGVDHGRMMSSPALTVGGKVFAFHTAKDGMSGMGFRLGRDYDFEQLPAGAWAHLAPFKTKPPMRDWVIIAPTHSDQWPAIAETALALMRAR